LSDYEKNQRLQDTLNNLNQRTAVLESGRTTRAAMRGDESTANRFSREESQRLNREAAGARTDTRNEGSMARARFVQGAIDARNVGRAKTDLYPAGTPAALYDELLTAKAAGGQQGAVSNGVYTEGARQGLFTGPQPIDSIIASVVTNVPPATRRKIESKAKLNPEPDQTTPESAPAAEPAAVPVPTQAPGPKEKADMANKIAAENPGWSRAQVLEELAKRLK
jgi:hypothetical protein